MTATSPSDLAVLVHAAELVITTQFGSAAFLQRRLGIGFLAATRLLDELEQHSIVGPHRTDRARDVLVPTTDLPAALARLRGDDPAGAVGTGVAR